MNKSTLLAALAGSILGPLIWNYPILFVYLVGAAYFFFFFYRDNPEETTELCHFTLFATLIWPLVVFISLFVDRSWIPEVKQDVEKYIFNDKAISFQSPIKLTSKPLTPEENAAL